MDLAWLLDETRWSIIQQLSKSSMQMSEISKHAKTSVANVSQHLQLLDAHGFLHIRKGSKGKPGKPAATYSLKKDNSWLVVMRPGLVVKKTVDGSFTNVMANILATSKADDHYYLQKFVIAHEDLLTKSDAICFLRSNANEIEVLVITELLDEMRKSLTKSSVKDVLGKERKFAIWSHSQKEIDEGLEKNDQYYIDLVKTMHCIYDPNGITRRWKYE